MQINFQATLEDTKGNVVSRAAGVAWGPVPVVSLANSAADATTSAVEELVRTAGAKLLARMPDNWEPSDESGQSKWVDARQDAPRPVQ